MHFFLNGDNDSWIFFYQHFFIIFIIIECVNSVDIQNKSAMQFNRNDKLNKTMHPKFIKCGDTQKMVDKCFTDLPPHLMEFLTTPKIAVDAKEIKAKCTVFDRGMECFDDYAERCLPQTKLNIFQNNVEGARNFFLKFCKDSHFQRDYLRHRECFSHIQDDWVRCTQNFHSILSDELHADESNITNKFMEFCCARYAFENCIYNSARYKCYQNSATFARETAKMLSDEKHFSNCRQYETALCLPANMSPLLLNKARWLLLIACLFTLSIVLRMLILK